METDEQTGDGALTVGGVSPQSRANDLDPNRAVIVPKSEPRLIFHDPHTVATTLDTMTVTVREAREAGAVACSACFDAQGSVQYDFPYVTGDYIDVFNP